MTQVLTINDIDRCRDICKKILTTGQTIAVDAEGLTLGANGRLTLLQIGLCSGDVYLIDVVNSDDVSDVQSGRDLLYKGMVKDVLESTHVLKITHGCSSDSAALYHQFDITLNNVFDTQCAWLAIQESKGKVFPKKVKLQDLLCEYGVDEHSCKDFKAVWLQDKQYWLHRPLTDEAIKYASEDVIVLFKLQQSMDSVINELKCRSQMEVYLDEELNISRHNDSVAEQIKNRKIKKAIQILKSLPVNTESTNMPQVFSEDERKAVSIYRKHSEDINQHLHTDVIGYVSEMEEHCCWIELDEIEKVLNDGGFGTIINGPYSGHLGEMKRHKVKDIAEKASKLQKEARISFLNFHITELERKLIACEDQISFENCSFDEEKALQYHLQYNSDSHIVTASEGVLVLQREMILAKITNWEQLNKENKLLTLNEKEKLTMKGLRKHEDKGIRERACFLYKTYKREETTRILYQIKSETVLSKLSDSEVKMLARYRKYKKEFVFEKEMCHLERLEAELSNSELLEIEKLFEEKDWDPLINGKNRKLLLVLVKHSCEDIRKRANRLQNKARVAFVKSKFEIIDQKIHANDVSTYEELDMDEQKAFQYYQQYQNELSSLDISNNIKDMEQEMLVKYLTDWEERSEEGSLNYKGLDLWEQKMLEAISKRNIGKDMNERAVCLYKKLKVNDIQLLLLDEMEGTEQLNIVDLSKAQLDALRYYQTNKKEINIERGSLKLITLELELSKQDLVEIEIALKDEDYESVVTGGYSKPLIKLVKHADKDMKSRARKLQKQARVMYVKETLTTLLENTADVDQLKYGDLSRDEQRALRYYQEYESEFKEWELAGKLQILDEELNLINLTEWETWNNNGELMSRLMEWQKGSLNRLRKHSNTVIREKATQLNKAVRMEQMHETLIKLDEKVKGGQVNCVKDLNQSEIYALGTLRQYRQDIPTNQYSQSVLELEVEMSHNDLEKWSNMYKEGCLRKEIKSYEVAILKGLSRHPDSGVQSRAKILVDYVTKNNCGRPHRGRGRGSVRGRGRGSHGRQGH